MAVLYAAVALLAVGGGGTRFNSATVGANQFDKAGDQEVFFNWFFILVYTASIIGATAIVYIQDRVSWALGFGLSAGITAIGAAVLFLGSRYYKRLPAQGSPFMGLAQAVVAAARKRHMNVVALGTPNYYYGTSSSDQVANVKKQVPSESFRYVDMKITIELD